ncbi:glycosyltransferase [Limnofasciculus baicalensis]|uniref:Glycosyltransferase n=1 Tax=Limnofasciculus baicalensis BBK-W-15 TaxID=2699891 RepID=A0AAE3GPU0_9CYAN|nr:glycosyltransferase [Limnofasciculus baicalensis]MCP2727688.1 glycosyltransferase [Limnofasciculus baicalensis BBK-W-15]
MNLKQKRVTWLIPVKNGMPYLPETLASIEAQTDKNWQVIVWNNGSTDDTVAELQKWIPSRLPGKVITGDPLSVGASLARMVEICDTEFCARIDADDVNLPERLEKQIAFLDAHPEVAVLGSKIHIIDASGVRTQEYTTPLDSNDIVHGLLSDNLIYHPSVMFRRLAILQVGNYQDLYPEDYDLWLRVATRYKLANLDLALVCYRVHSRSTTQIAIAQNKSTPLTNKCFSKNASLLYGLSPKEAILLRECRHPFATIPLYRVAKHLHKTQGGKFRDIFLSKSFIISTRQLISPRDIISRIIWWILWYYLRY